MCIFHEMPQGGSPLVRVKIHVFTIARIGFHSDSEPIPDFSCSPEQNPDMLRTMIRAQSDPSTVSQALSRIRAWLASIEKGSRSKIAEQAGVNEKTLRLATEDDWNPTADTLRKLEAIVPADWQPAKRKRAA